MSVWQSVGVDLWLLQPPSKNCSHYFPQGSFFHVRQFKVRIPHLRFSQEELKVSATKDAVVLNVAREVHGAGAVYCAVNLHVAVNDVQVLLLVLKNKWGGK